MHAKRDLIFAGQGHVRGGQYDTVKLTGDISVDGNLACKHMAVTGKSLIDGTIDALQLRMTGDASMNGRVRADNLRIVGEMRIEGTLRFQTAKLIGSLTVKGDMSGEEAHIYGMTVVEGDCAAETVHVKGGLTVDGLLNADDIDFRLYPGGRGCRVNEIGGRTITIRRKGIAFGLRRWLRSKLFGVDILLTADTIEGDDIYLEYTVARIVRGKNVTIGHGCRIELVEYRDRFITIDGAVVNRSENV